MNTVNNDFKMENSLGANANVCVCACVCGEGGEGLVR